MIAQVKTFVNRLKQNLKTIAIAVLLCCGKPWAIIK